MLFLVNAKKYKIFKSQNHNAFFQESYFQPNLVIATLYSAKANAAASLDIQQDPGSILTLPMSEHCCDGEAVRLCSEVTCSEPEIMQSTKDM